MSLRHPVLMLLMLCVEIFFVSSVFFWCLAITFWRPICSRTHGGVVGLCCCCCTRALCVPFGLSLFQFLFKDTAVFWLCCRYFQKKMVVVSCCNVCKNRAKIVHLMADKVMEYFVAGNFLGFLRKLCDICSATHCWLCNTCNKRK